MRSVLIVLIALFALVIVSGCTQQTELKEQKGQVLKVTNHTSEILDFYIKVTNITNPKLQKILGDVSYTLIMNASITVKVKNMGLDGEDNLTIDIGYALPYLEKNYYRTSQSFQTTETKKENIYLKHDQETTKSFNFTVKVPLVPEMLDYLEEKFTDATIMDFLYYRIS